MSNDLSPQARAEAAAGLMFELKAIDEARAALDAQRATKLAALRRLNGGPAPLCEPTTSMPTLRRAPLTLQQAAYAANRHPDTIKAWCRRYDIGWREAGRWAIDLNRLMALLPSLRS